MALRQATPGGGGRSRPDHFSYFWTPADKPWNGWIAGPTQWFKCHTSDTGTKPCLDWITSGTLPCPRCRPREIPADIGYLGVYREIDNAPILLVLHDNMWEESQHLSHGIYVKVSRPGGPEGTVVVQRFLTQKAFKSGPPRRKVPVDLTDMLLRIWGEKALTFWYECQHDAGTIVPPAKVDAAVIPDRVAGRVLLDAEKIAGMMEREAEINQERADAESALAKRLRKMKEAEKNGKHD